MDSLLFKIVIIGDSGVGKSNLMSKYASNEFTVKSQPTIGVEFLTKSLNVQNRSIKFQIWDSAGSERFRAISRSIYHGAKGAFIVYDITREESFENIAYWLKEIRQHVHSTCQLFLIGNKTDLEHLRVVKTEDAQKFAAENNITFLETSALDGSNVEKAFEWMGNSIYDMIVQLDTSPGKPSMHPELPSPTVKLNANKETKTEKKCSC